MQFHKVANIGELEAGTKRCIDIQGKKIMLCNIDGEYFAVDNQCTHKNASLSTGTIIGKQIECPWHGATFDLLTGKATSLPAVTSINTYEVKIDGEDILIKV